MSVRLNVVVVQSPRMTSLQVGIVAEIVIQLLGRPGIDLAMVASLESEEEHSTDRLMITSLENDLAIVDWRSADQTLASLATLGVDACRAPFILDPQPPPVSPSSRRVYVVDLRNGFKPNEVVEGIMKLLEQRQVVTVSLAGPKPTALNGKTIQRENIAKPANLPITPSLTMTPAKHGLIDRVPPNRVDADHPMATEKNTHSQNSDLSNDDAALDALVDSLNDSDL